MVEAVVASASSKLWFRLLHVAIGIAFAQACWASHQMQGDRSAPDANHSSRLDAAVPDGTITVHEAGLEGGRPPAPGVGMRPVELEGCGDFNAIWARREGDCGLCTDDAQQACGFDAAGAECAPSISCAYRHCFCDRPLGQGDCDQGQTAQVCACIDTCLVPGANPCRRGWSEWMACIVNECAGVCGL